MYWDDVQPWGEPTKDVYDLCMRVGGKNPFGKPNFRIVLAQSVRKLRGGLWHKWREGASLQNRGGLFVDEDGAIVSPSQEKPISVTAEMRWVKTYPVKDLVGWIFEEWYPAHMFGSPDQWGATKVIGTGLCQLGPYPTEGRYMLAGFKALPHIPPAESIRNGINQRMRQRDYWYSLTPEQRRKLEADADLAVQVLREKADDEKRSLMIRELRGPMLSTSLAAGRWREQLARSAGVRSHVGN